MQNDRVPYTRPGGKKPRPAAPRTPAPGRPPRKPAPRRRAIALGAVCALAVVLTVVIVILAGRDRGPQAPAVPDVGQSAGAWAKNENGFYFNDAGEPILAATSKGIDVSKYQGQVDWEKAQANGVEFALIRCGFGSEWNGEGDYAQDDEYWEYNADECTRLGIPFGTYLYSYATTEEQARLEGDHVARLLGLKAPDHEGLKDYTSKPYQLSLPVYYDLEDPDITGLFPDEMAALTAAFFDQLESYGYTGEQGIYASLNWTRARLTDPAFDAWRDNFWIARFNSTLGYTGPYTLWQASYTEPGAPYGVQSETVDVDFRMEELLITGFTDAKVSGAEPSFTNDTWENTLWLPNIKDKVTLTTDAVTEDEGGQRIFFASSDESVAAVSKKGVVTAKGEGSCTVTATLADGRRSAAVTVNVGAVTVNVYATGNLHGVADNGSVSLADVAALHAGDGGSILLDVGGSVQGTANTSLTGGMDMLSAFNAAGYDLQAFNAADLAFGPERLIEDAMVTSGPSLASSLQNADGTPLFYRSTSWSRNRITNGLQEVLQRAGKTIGFFTLDSAGYYAHAQGGESADALLRTMNEQVAALRAKGAQAIVCIAGPGCAVDAGGAGGPGRQRCAHQQPRRTDPHRARPAHPAGGRRSGGRRRFAADLCAGRQRAGRRRRHAHGRRAAERPERPFGRSAAGLRRYGRGPCGAGGRRRKRGRAAAVHHGGEHRGAAHDQLGQLCGRSLAGLRRRQPGCLAAAGRTAKRRGGRTAADRAGGRHGGAGAGRNHPRRAARRAARRRAAAACLYDGRSRRPAHRQRHGGGNLPGEPCAL